MVDTDGQKGLRQVVFRRLPFAGRAGGRTACQVEAECESTDDFGWHRPIASGFVKTGRAGCCVHVAPKGKGLAPHPR